MSSLSSRLSVHAPRMVCRGGGGGACSRGLAAGTVPGGGALTGPAGACAIALGTNANNRLIVPKKKKASRSFVFKGSSASLPKKAEVRNCHSLEPVFCPKDAFGAALAFTVPQLFGADPAFTASRTSWIAFTTASGLSIGIMCVLSGTMTCFPRVDRCAWRT